MSSLWRHQQHHRLLWVMRWNRPGRRHLTAEDHRSAVDSQRDGNSVSSLVLRSKKWTAPSWPKRFTAHRTDVGFGLTVVKTLSPPCRNCLCGRLTNAADVLFGKKVAQRHLIPDCVPYATPRIGPTISLTQVEC